MNKLPEKKAIVPKFRTPRSLPEAKKQIEEMRYALERFERERDAFAEWAQPAILIASTVMEHCETYADDAVSDHEDDAYAHDKARGQ